VAVDSETEERKRKLYSIGMEKYRYQVFGVSSRKECRQEGKPSAITA
jgi:hypothetical protein